MKQVIMIINNKWNNEIIINVINNENKVYNDNENNDKWQ